MKLAVVIGSRADKGYLDWLLPQLQADPFFEAWVQDFSPCDDPTPWNIGKLLTTRLGHSRPDMLLVLGDRYEILAAAFAAHLQRIPIAHLAGGDITRGSYDDAMRDCISRLAELHFAMTREAQDRLQAMGYSHVYEVGNLATDYILHGDWKRERPYETPYVVVSYQAETIDDTVDMDAVFAAVDNRPMVWIKPNPDRGNHRIAANDEYTHAYFLNLLYHCEEFIGNSSSMFYEAPALGVKCRIIGKRQQGRVTPPTGDGHASERIIAILKQQMPVAV